MCVCVCLYACVCVYVCTRVLLCVSVCACARVRACVYMRAHARVSACVPCTHVSSESRAIQLYGPNSFLTLAEFLQKCCQGSEPKVRIR